MGGGVATKVKQQGVKCKRAFCKDAKNKAKKEGKRSVSHRYNLLPLLPSGPDGVQRELVVRDLPMLTQDPAYLMQTGEPEDLGMVPELKNSNGQF